MLIHDHDFDSTVGTVRAETGLTEHEPCLTLERIPVARIDPAQLIDDAADDRGHAKVASIRGSIRSGTVLPPVVVIHNPADTFAYFLIEGRHRYNAAHAEHAAGIIAWVVHHDCPCVA